MPVRLSVRGREVEGSWGMDVMVAPERQRQGLGEVLFRTWDRNVGASLGLGLSDSSYRLFQKLRWPDVGPIPCLVKPLHAGAPCAGRTGRWPSTALVSARHAPFIRARRARTRPLRAEVRHDAALRRQLHRAVGSARAAFDVAVRRDAAYLNWKYASAPHVRYSHRRAAPRRPDVRLRRLPPRARTARTRHAARRLPRGSRRRGRLHDAAPLGRSRGARRGLRQDPHLRGARRLPPAAPQVRLFPGEVHDGVRHQGERGRRLPRSSIKTPDRWHITLGDSDQDR